MFPSIPNVVVSAKSSLLTLEFNLSLILSTFDCICNELGIYSLSVAYTSLYSVNNKFAYVSLSSLL